MTDRLRGLIGALSRSILSEQLAPPPHPHADVGAAAAAPEVLTSLDIAAQAELAAAVLRAEREEEMQQGRSRSAT